MADRELTALTEDPQEILAELQRMLEQGRQPFDIKVVKAELEKSGDTTVAKITASADGATVATVRVEDGNVLVKAPKAKISKLQRTLEKLGIYTLVVAGGLQLCACGILMGGGTLASTTASRRAGTVTEVDSASYGARQRYTSTTPTQSVAFIDPTIRYTPSAQSVVVKLRKVLVDFEPPAYDRFKQELQKIVKKPTKRALDLLPSRIDALVTPSFVHLPLLKPKMALGTSKTALQGYMALKKASDNIIAGTPISQPTKAQLRGPNKVLWNYLMGASEFLEGRFSSSAKWFSKNRTPYVTRYASALAKICSRSPALQKLGKQELAKLQKKLPSYQYMKQVNAVGQALLWPHWTKSTKTALYSALMDLRKKLTGGSSPQDIKKAMRTVLAKWP